MDERRAIADLIERLVREAGLSEPARSELRRELASHFAECGDTPEAMRAALARFGGASDLADIAAALRRTHEQRTLALPVMRLTLRTWLEHAGRDLRHAWRMIRRMPGLAAVIVVSLGIGIGVNTAVFSWVEMVIRRPLPGVADMASVLLVEPRTENGTYSGMSWPEYQDLRERVPALRELVAFRMVPLNVGETERAERSYGLLVSGNYFTALGLRPALGRFPLPDEAARAGGAPVAVVSYGFWQSRLAAARDAVGATLRVNDRELTVIGVAPRDFQGTVLGLDFDLWVPATLAPVLLPGSRELDDRTSRGYAAIGRLRPGATRAQAQQEVDAAMRELARVHPATNATMRAEVLPFWQAPHGPQRLFAAALIVLQGVMLLLLLAVCANIANLLLARASARQREIGVRQALGAGRWRIASLLMAESLVLALVGAGLGLAIGVWGTTALRAVPMIGSFPIRFQTSVDGVGLGVAALLGIGCGLLLGIAPALQLARVDPQIALRSGARSSGRSALRNALMGTEVALALLVLVMAAMFLRSFNESRSTDPGFRREGVLLAAYDLSGRGVDGAGATRFARELLERLRALPGVQSAAISQSVPLDIHGMPSRPFALEGHARDEAGEDEALMNIVTPDYFATMGIPLREGSGFAALGDASAPAQAVVNEAFVRRYLDGASPLGRRLTANGRSYIIAGVVRNSVNDAFGERPAPLIYYSYRDRPARTGQIHLRTKPGSEAALAADVRRAVRTLDPGLAIYDVRTLAEHVDRNLFLRRVPARMFAVLGPLLLVLAAIGIYAVVAYSVSRRTAEIGLRLALGASTTHVVGQIVRETMRVAGKGATVGWLLAFLVAIHVARGKPIDLVTMLGVPAVLMLVAAVASWLPARRAARVDPMVTLRQE